MLYIISPHIDDAILSIGGIIAGMKGKRDVMIKYVFSTSNWVNPEIPSTAGMLGNTELVTKQRVQEEATVSSHYHYQTEMMGFLDLPLRGGISFEKTAIDVQKKLSKSITLNDTCIFPLGLGHPDHMLVSAIGFYLKSKKFKILFYEDLPYASSANGAVTKIVNEHDLEPLDYTIDLDEKLRAIRMYESQVPTSWAEMVSKHASTHVPGSFIERLWRPARIKSNYDIFS